MPKRLSKVDAEDKRIDPAEVLATANAEPQRRMSGPLASEYASAIHVLRQKGLTWEEVRDWMSSRGMKFSHQTLFSSYRRWLKRVATPENGNGRHA